MRRVNATLPYVKVVRSRGNEYLYFDTGKDVKGKRVYKRLPAKSDRSFGGSYAALLGHRERRNAIAEFPTVAAVSKAYQLGNKFKKKARSTQNTYAIYLRVLEDQLGEAPINEPSRADLRFILDKMMDRPSAANMLANVTRQVFAYALAREWIEKNPMDGIEAFQEADEEHEPWPEELLERALGDPAVRLPVALLYYTAQRIGDVCKICWTDIREGFVAVTQEKTGKELDIRLHSALAAILAETPRPDDKTILRGPKGGAMRRATLRLYLQAWAKAQGFGVVPHGLRKNAVNALLEAGCSVGETSSISGQSLGMVEKYARRRNNRKMGDAAMTRWEANT